MTCTGVSVQARLALGDAGLGDLGAGEHAPRHPRVADRVGQESGGVHRGGATVHSGRVREHDLSGDVAAGVDVRDVGATAIVHRQRAAVAELNAGGLEPEALGVGPHPDAEQHVRAIDLATVLQDELHLVELVDVDRRGPAVLHDVHPAAQEDLLQHLGQIGIVVGQQLVAGRDQCHP